MASFTLERPSVFPTGTVVSAYAVSNWPDGQPSGAPRGTAASSGTVASDKVELTGLTENVTYTATAEVGGVRRYVGFLIPSPKAEGGSSSVVKTIAASGAAQTLPAPTEAGIVDLTLTAACTITLPAPVKGGSLTLWLRQGAGGPWIVTWAGTVKWGYGSAPALTPSAEAIDVVSFASPDGTAWYGFPGGYEFK